MQRNGSRRPAPLCISAPARPGRLMRAPGYRTVLTLVGLVLVACEGPRQHPNDRTAVRDSAGIEIVEHVLGPNSSVRFVVSPTPSWTLGSLMGGDTHAFGSVVDAGILKDGSIVVLDLQAAELRRFTGANDPGTVVAIQGEGPGEFGWPSEVHVLKGDTMALGDLDHRAMLLYGPDGRSLGRRRLTGTPAIGADWRVADTCCRSVGMLASGTAVWRTPERYRPDGKWHRGLVNLVLVPDSDRAQVIGPFEGSLYGPSALAGEEGLASQALMSFPLSVAVSGAGVVVGNGASAEVRWLDGVGKPTRIVRWDTPVRQVSRRQVDSVRDKIVDALGSDAPPAVLRSVTAGPVADQNPVYEEFLADHEGGVWVRLPGAGDWADYLVFSPAGEFTGRARLPGGTRRVVDIRDNHVLVMRQGTFGESYVEMWDLQNSSAGDGSEG